MQAYPSWPSLLYHRIPKLDSLHPRRRLPHIHTYRHCRRYYSLYLDHFTIYSTILPECLQYCMCRVGCGFANRECHSQIIYVCLLISSFDQRTMTTMPRSVVNFMAIECTALTRRTICPTEYDTTHMCNLQRVPYCGGCYQHGRANATRRKPIYDLFQRWVLP